MHSTICRILLIPLALFLATADPLFAGAKKAPPVTIRLHGEASPSDGASFSAEITLLHSQEKIRINKVPVVSERDIRAFLPFLGTNGSIGAYFLLDAHGANKLQQFSIEDKGGQAVALVNGRVAAALKIDKPVKDGILYVPGGILPEEIKILQKSFPLIGEESKKR
jgi:hypothetical protein